MSASVWSRAAELAGQTPAARNRSVDFLRAASIIVVVLGHWLMAAPWVDASGVQIEHMLEHAQWTQWLTWGLQVMPVFFFVGGYANGISYDASRRNGLPWREWLAARLVRLLRPVLVLVLFWAVADSIALAAGVPAGIVKVASQVALVPTWFLAVYVMVVLLVPLARRGWDRYGMASFWAPAAAAAVLDLAYFQLELHGLGWLNYLFVWSAVHQLGLAWLDGRVAARGQSILLMLGGLAALVVMTELGPWPHSLVGVPGEEVSNTTPPHLPLLALACLQFGGVRLVEARLRSWLTAQTPWTGTVLINGMIMTTFLWHSTVMMLLFGLALLLGGAGLQPYPGTPAWWAAKLAWIVGFAVVLVPVVLAASRFERGSGIANAPPVWRQIVGAVLVGLGLGWLAYTGGVADETDTLAWLPFLLPFAGAALAGMIAPPGRRQATRA
jgi:hypothetical protein